jgi:tetratricopeptide (TPR) repeat protein
MDGRPAALMLTSANSNADTLAPAFVPPVVADVTLVLPTTSPQTREPNDGAMPAVPGYDILRELGRGGMGVVYLARHRELKRLVALKMILAGAHADEQTKARFRREAEAVARLQHPGIVQIHDVGEHLGQPYLVLEFVDGSNLAGEIVGSTIAAETAAALTESLARTVHYAHERGIVHRDLTPRNVLLARTTSSTAVRFGPDGDAYEPKITDFGLAKELDGDTDYTQTGVIIGTPSYMSPEQAQGRPQDVGAAADIHALGAILYELVTGRPPFLSETRLDTLKQVVEADPLPPSRLQPTCPRDLETICLKCLAKEPNKRYATAGELADDLHRFLVHKPIHARPVSWHERTWKWVRRYPAAAALLGVIFLSLLILASGALIYSARVRRERDRAETNFALAMRAVDEMLSEVGEQQLAAEPRMEEKRRTLLAKALELNKAFLQQKTNDPRIRWETAQAHRRMADVFRLLEQHEEALEGYQQAATLFQRLHDESPDDPTYRQQLGHTHTFRGEVFRAAGRRPEAETAYDQARLLQSELAIEFPSEPTHRQDLARTLYSLGILLRENGRLVESERELRLAADLLTQLVEEFPANPAHRQHLARAFLNLGTVVRSPDRFDEAQAVYNQAIDLLRTLTVEFPHQPDYRHELGVVCNNSGNLLASAKRLEEARTKHAESRALFQALSADFPKIPAYRQELANTLNSIGSVESQLGAIDDAVKAWGDARLHLEALIAERDDVAAFHGDLGMVLGNLGLAAHTQSKLAEARQYFERAAEQLQRALASNRDDAMYQEMLRDTFQNLAEVLVVTGDHAGGAKAARNLADARTDSAHDCYYAGCFLARCVAAAQNDSLLDSIRRETLAQSYADESVAMLRKAILMGFDDLEQLQNDRQKAFPAIADRSDFKALVEQLSNKKPANLQ